MSISLRTPTLADSRDFLAAVERSRRLHHPWLEAPTDGNAYRAYCERIARSENQGFLIVEGVVGSSATPRSATS